MNRLFAEAAATLQGFQTQVLGFIEEGEATMLGRSQGDLRRQEEQRSRLSQARHNLGQVHEADSVSFLQVRAWAWGSRQREEKAVGPSPSGPHQLLAAELSHPSWEQLGPAGLSWAFVWHRSSWH